MGPIKNFNKLNIYIFIKVFEVGYLNFISVRFGEDLSEIKYRIDTR
jgi:hypothetical protein